MSIQDITALLVSLTNLSLSCYPDRLEYVDQILGFAHSKIKEFADRCVVSHSTYASRGSLTEILHCSSDLHAPQTAANLAALLVAPINSYQSVLTLLAIPRYVPLLSKQLFSTRRSIAHSVVSSVLKNETVIETPGDVDGVLDLCHVLIKDQMDPVGAGVKDVKEIRRQGPYGAEKEDVAEEQGWLARMVHLFRAESLDVQFEVSVVDIGCDPGLTRSETHSCCERHGDTTRREVNGCGTPSLRSSPRASSSVGGTRTANSW